METRDSGDDGGPVRQPEDGLRTVLPAQGEGEPAPQPRAVAPSEPSSSAFPQAQNGAVAAESSSDSTGIPADEQQCRICRSGAEEDAPLFRPCKCSGSIQYCHQDCLIEWLGHSHKKYCELCGHPFVFRKRYKSSLPKGLDVRCTLPFRLPEWLLPDGATTNPPTLAFRLPLPAYLYVRRMALQAFGWLITGLRGILVLITWLVFLPLININVWRSYFWMSDTIVNAWKMALHQTTPVTEGTSSAASELANATNGTVSLVDFLAGTGSGNVTASYNATSQLQIPVRGEYTSIFRSILSYCSPSPQCAISPLVASADTASRQLAKSPKRTFQFLLEGVRYHVDISEFCHTVERTSLGRAGNPFGQKLLRLVAHTAKGVVQTSQTCVSAGFGVCSRTSLRYVRRWVSMISKDLMEGQFLTCAVIVIFVGVFLLREWVVQNLPQVVENVAARANALRQQNAALEEQIADTEQRLQAAQQQGRELEQQIAEAEQQIAQAEEQAEFARLETLEATQERERLEARIEELHRRHNELDEQMADAQQQIPETPEERPEMDQIAAQLEERRARIRAQIHEEATATQQPPGQRPESDPEPASHQDPAQFPRSETPPGFDEAGPSSHTGARLPHPDPSTPALIQSYRTGGRAGPSNEFDDSFALRREAFGARQDPGIDDIHSEEDMQSANDGDEQVQAEDAPAVEDDEEPAEHAHLHRGLAVEIEAESDDEEDEDEDEDDEEEEDDDENALQLHDEDGRRIRIRVEEVDMDGIHPGQEARPGEGDDEREVDEGLLDDWEDAEQMGALDEELDGMLEAIGMRGPIVGLVQNAALMVILCSFALMVFVAVPYVAGRTFGFGDALLHLSTVPVKVVRVVTDPTFDALIDATERFVLQPFLKALSRIPLRSWTSSSLSQNSSSAVLTSAPIAKATVTAAAMGAGPFLSKHWWTRDSLVELLDTGRQYFISVATYLDGKTKGDSVSDRVVCVLLGHSYWLVALAVDGYFNFFKNSPQLQWLRAFVDMQRFIIKVLFFMVIELLVFPVGCGIVLDICLSPLSESATFHNRLQDVISHPLTFVFVRWVGGTLYMFGFAQWVGSTRTQLRKGVLAWIRDPNDPSFSPVREILERKTLVQLRKIFSSAIMYTWLLVSCVGFNLFLLRKVWVGVLPLRWRPFNNLSAVPFDLIVLYHVIPLCIRILRPGTLIRKLSRKWWSRAAKTLRLSHYLLGKDALYERGHVQYTSWSAWFRGPSLKRPEEDRQGPDAPLVLEGPGWTHVPDGSFARVPADDSPAPESRMFIMVDRQGIPVDEENERALRDQEIIVESMTNKPRYEVVYLPPNFRWRIYALFFMLWLSVSLLLQMTVGLPVIVGRTLFGLFSDKTQHDFYTWSVGCPVLVLPAASIYRLWSHRRRARRREQAGLAPSASASQQYSTLARCRQLAITCYFGLAFGVVIPFLIGMTVRVYLIEPWLDVSQLAKPVPVFQTWAMGLMEQSLLIRVISMQNDGWAQRLKQGIDQVNRNGTGRNANAWQATKTVILPSLLALILLLTAPPLQVGLNFALRPGPPLTPTLQQSAVRAAYKWFSLGLATAKVLRMMVVRIDQWTMALKDELFLESTELTNYGAEEALERGRNLRDQDGSDVVGLLPDHFI
ncbi:hypothetical protein OC861_000609 [Tilletia horrida]|nr:hypothetical protein OC861_000609 [Tilletia horrida]